MISWPLRLYYSRFLDIIKKCNNPHSYNNFKSSIRQNIKRTDIFLFDRLSSELLTA